MRCGKEASWGTGSYTRLRKSAILLRPCSAQPLQGEGQSVRVPELAVEKQGFAHCHLEAETVRVYEAVGLQLLVFPRTCARAAVPGAARLRMWRRAGIC